MKELDKSKIKIENSDSTSTLENDRVPFLDELKCLYDARTDDRTRVFSGLFGNLLKRETRDSRSDTGGSGMRSTKTCTRF